MQIRIIPAINTESIVGVRTPELKSMAKELLKGGDYRGFLEKLPHRYEEKKLADWTLFFHLVTDW